MRRTVLIALLAAGAIAVAISSHAQQRGRVVFPPVGDIQKLRDNLYLIPGQGGNTAVFVAASGVVLVDTKLANNGQAILDRVKSVTDKPITTIINSHHHGDHIGSNEFFPASVEIVAQENAKANMEQMAALRDKPNAMPDRTFKDKASLMSGADRIDLYHFGPGHTNGDTLIVFPALRFMHGGDLFAFTQPPIIVREDGGSAVALPDTLQKAINGIKNVDRIITGHGLGDRAMVNWKDFVEFAEFNREFLKAVKTAHQAGRTAEQAAAALKLPSRFNSYMAERPIVEGGDFLTTAARVTANVSAIYSELTK